MQLEELSAPGIHDNAEHIDAFDRNKSRLLEDRFVDFMSMYSKSLLQAITRSDEKRNDLTTKLRYMGGDIDGP